MLDRGKVMGKIPVYILSGFLGSGKTTLLKQLLHTCSEKNINPAVLMNEIGKQIQMERVYQQC